MTSPVFDPINKENNTGKIIPIYPLIKGITQNNIRKIIQNGLNSVENIEETIPDYIVKKYNLKNYNDAIHEIHFPKNLANLSRLEGD